MFNRLFKRKRKETNDMPTTTSTSNIPFVKLTRVYYKNKGKTDQSISTQPIFVRLDKIETFRPRNKIGTKENGNRCTIQTTSGKYINVKERFSEVESLIQRASNR